MNMAMAMQRYRISLILIVVVPSSKIVAVLQPADSAISWRLVPQISAARGGQEPPIILRHLSSPWSRPRMDALPLPTS
jgi:hypothetical protein